MSQVEAAVKGQRIVLAVGGRARQDPAIQKELALRSGIPAFGLDQAGAISEAVLAPLRKGHSLLVLVEPDTSGDTAGLNALEAALKGSKMRPKLLVVARSFNPFMLPMSMRLMKLDHSKKRAMDFLSALPVVEASTDGEAAAAAAPAKKKKGSGAPRVAFLGREEELPLLREKLAEGGPLALVGPIGIGRSWLLATALDGHEAVELAADVRLSRSCGFDALTAVLATVAGDEALVNRLKSRDAIPPQELVDGVLEAINSDQCAGKVVVVRRIRYLQHPDGSLMRQDRLGLLIHALLTRTYALRVVFLTDREPRFFREGQREALTVLKLGGLKGRELFGIFEAYQAEEAPRDKMGEVFNQTAGHPMATRAYAVSWKVSEKKDKLFDDKRFLKLNDVANLEPLVRHLQRRVEKLDQRLGGALIAIGHSPRPLLGAELSEMGINRDIRIQLSARGLLESTPVGDQRGYYLHDLIKGIIGGRALSEFGLMEELARRQLKFADKHSGAEKLVLQLGANELMVGARLLRSRVDTGFRDNDPIIATVNGLMRARQPRLDIARQRVVEGLKRDPGNTELHLIKADILAMEDSPEEKIMEALELAREQAPTIEIWHWEAHWRDRRNKKGDRAKAVAALRAGADAYPQDAGIRRRLGAILTAQSKWVDAEKVLRESMELEAGNSEAYARLGEVLLAQGPSRWDDAEAAIRYASELDPERGSIKSRLAMLLRRRAAFAEDGAAALQAEAKELLEAALKDKPSVAQPYVELAALLLDTSGDLDRADWCLKQATKQRGGKSPETDILVARVMARTGRHGPAESRIQRALKAKGKAHAAHAALGELHFAQGRVFMADQEFGKALELSTEGSMERALYRREKTRLEALITSGQAVEIEKAAEKARTEQVVETPHKPVTPADLGGTKVRRKADRQKAPVVAPSLASLPKAGEASIDTPMPAEAAPVLAAPVVAAPVVAAPVEAAPVEAAPVEAAPVEAAPIVEAPVVAAPVVDAPVVEAPVVQAPADPEPEAGA